MCLEKGVGVVGMKGLGGGGEGQGVIPMGSGLTAAECYRYALSLPVSSQVMGLTSLDQLKQAVAVGRAFERFFIANHCPLAFMEATGRNRTPDKLPREERDALYAVCDRALARVVRRLDEVQIAPEDIALRQPTLDDVFLSITGHTAEETAVDPVGAKQGRRSRRAR